MPYNKIEKESLKHNILNIFYLDEIDDNSWNLS